MPDLARLLRPRSIAVVGGRWAAAVVELCRRDGFAGQIWPVHPERETVAGVRAHRSLAELPAAPDACFLAVNRDLTVDLVAELAALGAGGAVCFASGFAETGAADRQRDLVAAAGTMPILGPNCYGFLNYLDGAHLWPDQHGGVRVERGVALISQSGNIACNLTMQARGLPVAYVFSLGNQAQLGFSDLVSALLDDPRVTAIGLVMEALDDAVAFAKAAALARERGVPIVVLKLGASAEGAATAVGHTASLAGSDRVASAYFAKLGVARVRSLGALLETLKLLDRFGPLPGADLASLSCSGGEAALVADAAAGRKLVRLRPFADAERAAIAATLPPIVAIANPLDYHTHVWGDVDRLEAVYGAVLATGRDLVLLVLDFPRRDRCDPAAWLPCVEALARAVARTGARAAILATLPECLPEELAIDAMSRGIAVLVGVDDALDAIEAAAGIGRASAAPLVAPEPLPPRPRGEPQPLDEAHAKMLLRLGGLEVPPGQVAPAPGQVLEKAAAVGYPVVLKALAGLAHKTEAGAVVTGLGDPEALVGALATMRARHGEAAFLVERMVEGAVAELVVGIRREEPFGFALTLGAGGVLAELLADSVTLLLPAGREAIGAALADLRMHPLLRGQRGRPGADLEAATDAIAQLVDLAMAERTRLLELEVNPLILTPTSAVAVDALIVLGEAP